MSFEALRKLIAVVTAAVTALFQAVIPIGKNEILRTPAVYEYGGDSYCVIWETTKKGTGYVKYTVDGEEKVVWDESLGLIKTDDTVHKVYVPKEELRGSDYVVGSQYVFFKYAYHALKGGIVESQPYHFRGVEKDDDIRVLCVSDVHGRNAMMQKAAENAGFEPDLVCLLGDVRSNMEQRSCLSDSILDCASILTKGEIPIVYVRGNHETRGEFAAQLPKYLPTAGGEMYFTFDFGPLSAVVLDTGEDKDDDHPDYNGLVDFAGYRAKQFEWIRSLKAEDFTEKYKIVFTHMPALRNMWGQDWASPFADMGFDLIVGAHLHTAKSWNHAQIPIVIDGGERDDPDDFWIGAMRLHDGAIDLNVTDTSGACVYSFSRAADGACTETVNF